MKKPDTEVRRQARGGKRVGGGGGGLGWGGGGGGGGRGGGGGGGGGGGKNREWMGAETFSLRYSGHHNNRRNVQKRRKSVYCQIKKARC